MHPQEQTDTPSSSSSNIASIASDEQDKNRRRRQKRESIFKVRERKKKFDAGELPSLDIKQHIPGTQLRKTRATKPKPTPSTVETPRSANLSLGGLEQDFGRLRTAEPESTLSAPLQSSLSIPSIDYATLLQSDQQSRDISFITVPLPEQPVYKLSSQLEQLRTDENDNLTVSQHESFLETISFPGNADVNEVWQPHFFEDAIEDTYPHTQAVNPEHQSESLAKLDNLDSILSRRSPQHTLQHINAIASVTPLIPITDSSLQNTLSCSENSGETVPNIDPDQQAAIQAIIQCLQPQCSCTNAESTLPGKSLEEIVGLISSILEKSELLTTYHHAPLSLPKPISMYPNPPQWLNWKALLSGQTLDPVAPNLPPTLDFDLSQEQHMSKIRQEDQNMVSEFDIDSVIFLARSLGVFRRDIDWSFRPSYTSTQQQNQRIRFPGIDMTRDKCLHVCSEGRWTCHIFFGHMPLTYTNEHGSTVKAESQHLDDYALRIWTDQILLPAISIVCGPGRRHHYPPSFDKIRSDANIKSEFSFKANSNRVDTKKMIPANQLVPLWSQILALAQHVPATALPSDAFAEPQIIISCHNLKLAAFSKDLFPVVRANFEKYANEQWNMQYTDREHFWLDLGFERILPSAIGTTVLRKQACNKQWAEYFRDPDTNAISSTEVDTFPWAGTQAGSVSVNTTPSNALRRGGLGYCKAYNIIKEQHATQSKGSTAFQEPLLEALSYSQEHLNTWARKRKNQNQRPERGYLFECLQKSKARIHAPFETTEQSDYGDRQEWRMTLSLFYALPENLGQTFPQSVAGSPQSHTNYWLLTTKDVNEFRMAELNRWLVTLECVANIKPGNLETKSLLTQEINSFMVTAMVRIMRLSIGCLNPQQFPSLWSGKRWAKSSFSNSFQNQVVQSSRTFQRRQGLDLEQSVKNYGMMWLPYHLCLWDLPLPQFRVQRYPNLDIGVNKIRATLNISSAALAAGNQESLIREYTRIRIQEIIQSYPLHKRPFLELCDILAQMCVQAYNLDLWDEVTTRWIAHTEDKYADAVLFEKKSGRSELSKLGLEVVSFSQLREYLGRHGVDAIEFFEIAFCKRKTRSTHFPTWSDNTWKGRISPLFRLPVEQPNWARNTRYVRKFEEIVLLLRELSSESSTDYTAVFTRRLEITAARHMQAIFHYDNDKAISVAKASTHNSQQTQETRRNGSQLQKTKWMFPRFSDEHVKELAIVNGHSTNKTQISTKHGKSIADEWLVLTEADKTYQSSPLHAIPIGYPPKSMVYKGSHTGGADTLAKLQAFIEEAKEWASMEAHMIPGGKEDSGDETEWPVRPDEGSVSTLSEELD